MNWFFLIFIFSSLHGALESQIKHHYLRLSPHSLEEHLAFFELYPNTKEGKDSLETALKLIGQEKKEVSEIGASLSFLINRGINTPLPDFEEETLNKISSLGEALPNRKLLGFQAQKEEEVLALPDEEIDLARALFLSLDESDKKKSKTYEALLDLMSLSLKARMREGMSDEEKIHLINTYIFYELGYRFPPQSLFAKQVDLYTFLSSVLDSRRGVCLGVSLLYLCLAERLNLPLSIVTPPGHIFVRYKKDDVVINIETTARGIHLDSEHYLNLETKELEERTLKETIGFAHVNEASVFLQNKEYKKALKAYKKAKLYAPKDKTLNTILGLTHILLDEEEEGERLLKEVKEGISSKEIIDHTLIDDYFNGETSKEGIALLFLPHEKGRESILKRKTLLEEHLKSYPRCRTTLFGVATCWLELHREKEALEILKEYHKLDPKNLTVEYYLSSLYLKREDLPSAWKHYKGLKALCDEYDHNPKVLKDLFKTLKTVYPNS